MRYEREQTEHGPGCHVLTPESAGEAELTRFERALGEKLLAGDDLRLAVGRRQLAAASVAHRDFSGFGFFIVLHVPEGVPAGDPAVLRNGLGSAMIRGPGLQHDAGAIFLCRAGRIRTMETFAYGESWPFELARDYVFDRVPTATIE